MTGDEAFIYAARGKFIRRYRPDGSHAGFPSGGPSPFDGGTDNVQCVDRPEGYVAYVAADAARHRLYAEVLSADKGGGNPTREIQVFDITDGIKPLAKWPIPTLGPLVCAPDGTLWVTLSSDPDGPKSTPTPGVKGGPARIARYASDGKRLPQTITGPLGFVPVALCLDAKGRLLVADNGPDQNVKIYGSLASGAPHLGGTFGIKGGIYAGPVPGRVGPLRFCGLTGVGVDTQGNIYVGQNRYGPWANGYGVSGSILESYKPSGVRNWRLQGLEFVDCADVDPGTAQGDHLDVYTKLGHYTLDLSKKTPGSEATYVGHTMNPFKFPSDDRFATANDNFDIRGGAWIRRIAGHKFLFMNTMAGGHLQIYRFSPATDGEIAIPCGRIDNDRIWRDANGNGREDSGETLAGPGVPPALAFNFGVDSKGDVWETSDGSNNSRVRHLIFQSLDSHGSPIWDYAPGHFTEESSPAPFQDHGLYRIQYEPATDTMYLSGYSNTLAPRRGYGTPAYAVKNIGSVVARYDHWSKGNRTAAWAIVIPYGGVKHDYEHADPAALSVAGDYVFIQYEYLFDDANSGRIQVYRASDGGYVGTIHAGPGVGNLEGATDIPYGVRAYKRASGEYLIFSEEDYHAKVLMYRWTPGAK